MNNLKTILDNGTHKIEIDEKATVGMPKDVEERSWRDLQLEKTDILSLLNDYPNKVGLMNYRNALRDYPAQPDFPNGQRPEI